MKKLYISTILGLLGLLGFGQSTATFTTSGTWTCPAGVTSVTVECWGAGGGGGGSINSNNNTAGGGGGGGYTKKNSLAVTPGATYTVTIGTGGAGGAVASNGTNGTNTSFSTIIANGGSRGICGASGANGAGGNGGAASITGDINYYGGNGASGVYDLYGGGGGGAAGSGGNGVTSISATGGAATAIDGGKGGNGAASPTAGSNYGGGGGGGFGKGKTGAAGANGYIKITYTCVSYSLTGTSATSPVFTGGSSIVTLTGNAANLPVGTYTATYSLSGSNTATGLTATMTVSTPGTGTFTTSALANAGATTITITNLSSGTGTPCSSVISANNTSTTTVNAAPSYCANTNTTNVIYYISSFSTTGGTTNITNNSSGFSTNGYGNFTGMIVTQVQGSSVNFSITETGGTMHFGIWVDWNNDGDFVDAGEEVYINNTSYNTTVTGSFTVPITATAGSHRMRVVGNESGTVAACTGTAYTECEDYTINVVTLTACSGTPNAGTASISSASGCVSTNFTLSATGLTVASGITYQWQSGTSATGPWTNISGANSATLTTSATANTWYRLVTTCANGGGLNNTNVVSYTVVADVCSCGAYPSNYASNTADEDVSNVTVGTLNNSSALGAVAGGAGSVAFRYSNYTGIVAAPNLQQLVTTSFSFSSLTTGSNYNNGFQAYIDYNQDGDFADAGEQVYSSAASTSGPHTETGSFVVPISATLGITRMRVICIETTFPSATNYASSVYSYGETEDYCVNITAATACSGTPNAGTASISSASGCASANFTLTASGLTTGSGISYQWQSGTSATGPWTNIAGATSTTLTTSAATNTWYQLVTTCTNGGALNNTNVVSYTVVGDVCTCGAYPAIYASSTVDEDISNVTVGTLNNSSTLGAVAPGAGSIAFRYSNYTGSVAAPSLQQLATTNFSISSLTTGTSYSHGFQIYIDYNQNGVFENTERCYSSAASTSGPHTETGNFVVPLSAMTGITRMRVVSQQTTFPSTTNYASTAYTWGETEDYCVDITAATACSGTPNAGTASISSASGCASTNITLSATGLTAAGGITYQWQSGPSATGPWTNIAGATSSTLTTSATANTWYQLVTTCTNGTFPSNTNYTNVVSYSVVGNACSCGAYPAIYASSTVDEDISNVTVGTLNNSSALGAVAPGAGSIAFRYSNYTGAVAAPSIQQLATTNFSISSLTTGTSYSHGFQIYIDYNQNGVFENTERCYSSAASTSGPHTETGNFVVPLTAMTGITRMRVVSQQTTFPSTTNYASTAYTWGETEDYCVNITAAPPCSGSPTGGSTTASSTACGHTGAISVTGSTSASGLTYQWYSAPASGGPWTPIAGATGATYTPAGSGLYYQRIITCTFSGLSATSSSLQYITSSPANDECVNATPLTVNTGATCTAVTAGTVNCATASAQSNSCSGTADDDVWFSFVATNASHTISLLNIAGSVTDMYHSIYSGTCGALTEIKCNDADVSTVTGLTVGATYYVRVYTYTGTAGQTTTFNICVSTSTIVSVAGSSTCENAVAFCASNDSPGVDFEITDDLITSPAGQCTFMKNPSWWYMQISQNGDLDMTIASSCGDVDFACYGPFANITCLASDLTNPSPSLYFNEPELHITYNPTSEPTYSSTDVPFCEVATLAQPSGNLVDFGGDIDATEYLQIRNAVVGQYYIVLIGNYKQCAGTVSFNQTNFGAAGAGAADCQIVTQCNITSITATTTITGSTYTVSGDINFIDPPATGTLKICDGTVCQTFTAPFTSPQAYTLTGLIPDGLQHQLTATFSSPTVNCEKISNYTSPPSTLPVNLVKLTTSCQNSTAAIYWQTASETNNDYFVIEKRNSNNEFYEIGRIDGAGNSNSVIDYMFIDNNLLPGDNYYRLSQVDFDGTKTMYPTITLNCDNYIELQPTMDAYPNPFVDEVNVVIQNLDEGEFTLEIINELGKVVYQKKCIASKSEFRTLLNLYNLQPAVYNLQCRSQKNVLTIRVIKE